MKQRSYVINLVSWGLAIVLFGMLLVFSRLGSAPSYVYGSAYGSTYSSTDPSLRALLAYSLPASCTRSAWWAASCGSAAAAWRFPRPPARPVAW